MPAQLTGADLRRRSFRDQDLRGAVLRSADLRGADFRGANLRGADLSAARTGMHTGWAVLIVIGALALSILMGVASAMAGERLRGLIASGEPRARLLGVLIAAELVVLLVAGAWKGLHVVARRVLPALAGIAIAGWLLSLASGLDASRGALALPAFALLCAVIFALGSLARAVAGTAGSLLFIVVAVAGALAGGLLGGGLTATAIAVGSMLAGRRALTNQAIHPRLATASAAIAARGGTRFAGADLSGATFASARLRSCDFRGATLAGTRLNRAAARLCLFDRRIASHDAH